MSTMKHVGLDVHVKSIWVAVADDRGVRNVGRIAHDMNVLRRRLERIGEFERLHVVYEAGPTGYGLYRKLSEWGIKCSVVAPSLIPRQSGGLVKTDRIDANKLAHMSYAGLLTEVIVPSEEQEAIRDLVRARSAAKSDHTQIRQELNQFLVRHHITRPKGVGRWTQAAKVWLRSIHLEQPAAQRTLEDYIMEEDRRGDRVSRLEDDLHELSSQLSPQMQYVLRALQGLKGVNFLTAITIVSELGDITRFASAPKLMSYAGVVPREYSSGDRVKKGSITKAGNAHLRRVAVEASWCYARGHLAAGAVVKKRRKGLSKEVLRIVQKADARLRKRFMYLERKGKSRNKVVVAIGRELLGFIWAVAQVAQAEAMQLTPA